LREGHYRVVLDTSAATGISDLAGAAPTAAAAAAAGPGVATDITVTSFDVEATP
jgi:hypothetical protein